MCCFWGMARGWGLEEQGCSFVLRVEQGKSCSGDKEQPLTLPRPAPTLILLSEFSLLFPAGGPATLWLEFETL